MKRIVFWIFFLNCSIAWTQSVDFNLQKYWYLRWRLKNYFMVVGPNYGEGYPFGIRGWYGNNLNAGDIPNYLATYMGILATEIKILKSKGQDYTETKRELYYALYALNRLDDCENQYPWGGFNETTYQDLAYPSSEIGNYTPNPSNLNGACLRGDTPNDFVFSHYDALHKNFAQNFTNNNPGDPPLLGNGPFFGMWDEGFNKQFGIANMMPYGWTSLEQMLYPLNEDGTANTSKPKQWNHAIDNIRSGSMLSQDHISSLYMGLALVVKSLDEYETYNDLPFQDGVSSFVNEARNITQRIRSYMRSTNYNLRLINGDVIPNNWGGDAYLFSNGFGKAAKWILDAPGYDNTTNFIEELTEPSWRGFLGLYAGTNTSNAWILLKLFAVGNNSGRLLYSETAENNQQFMYNLCYDNDWQSYYPLVHSYLHNTPCLTTIQQIENDLNLMPCSGHYRYGSDYPSDWASSHKFQSNSAENNGGSGFEGAFTGLEYMLMLNLTILNYPTYIYDYKYANFSGKIEQEYPYVLIDETIGADPINNSAYNIHPATIYSIEPLTINTQVKNGVKTVYRYNWGFPPIIENIDVYLNANVTFRSVGSITIDYLDNDPNTTMLFENDPYECSISGSYYKSLSGQIGPNEIKEHESEINLSSDSAYIGSIHIWPNPSQGQIIITANDQRIQEIQVFDLFGNLLYQNKETAQTIQLDLTNFKSGVYLLNCILENEIPRSCKLILN